MLKVDKRKNIVSPQGFKAAGFACGLKKSGKPDLALIFSEVPATAAGVFTTNQVKAAPIIYSQKQIRSGIAQAIIVNSGNANCWTGTYGFQDAKIMAQEAAKALKIPPKQVLVASTGVIGVPLPMEKIKRGIKVVARRISDHGFLEAASAILTTDTRPKIASIKVGKITILGLAKGSGMIAPGMATMQAFILTDALISKSLLRRILRKVVDKSFNMISVDNCMSTNDCVFALANGMSGVRVKGQGSRTRFAQAFEKICIYLSREIARDGEGATKLIEVRVKGARNRKEAQTAVKALIGSFLLKAAVYGKDRNFGRILQAVGATEIKVNWKKFKWDWKMKKKEDIITVDLSSGKASAVGWGCDLTEGYVRINAKYHT
ncbi:MAG: bifunctional glutamate N-acetyltransferase/amino-acid acetyltransferase ArgJ [Candidatus Margulisiibacteriota bacterium]